MTPLSSKEKKLDPPQTGEKSLDPPGNTQLVDKVFIAMPLMFKKNDTPLYIYPVTTFTSQTIKNSLKWQTRVVM